MKVCYFGGFDPRYSRNRIIIKGLEAHGIDSIIVQSQGSIARRYFDLIKNFLNVRNEFQTMIVGFPGWFDVPLAFVLSKLFHKKLLFDVFTPLYETYVLDRHQVRIGFFYYFLDYINMKLSDVVLADTQSHLKEYIKMYHLNSQKGLVIYVGSDDQIFKPKKMKLKYQVMFYGSYQPLQGVEYIIETARLVPEVEFTLIGKGQTKEKIVQMVKDYKLKNVHFIDWISLETLSSAINQSQVVLGIFGNTPKSQLVIPNKVYDGLACKKIVITAKTPASDELFSKGRECLLVDVSQEDSLAKMIRKVFKDKNKYQKIAEKGYTLYKSKLMPKYIVNDLIHHV